MATGPIRLRRGRTVDLLAMAAIGVAVVGAALLPAVTASSGETITIRGDVQLNGRPVPFFPVGFWAPGPGAGLQVEPTRTDANGGFTLDVPATVDGYAYAGAAPNTGRAVVPAGRSLAVRGVIGGSLPSGRSTPLYQGFPSTTARALNARGRLRFSLQSPGRVAGTSSVPGDRLRSLEVRRLDGSVVQALHPDARGRFVSTYLAVGTYAVVAVPRAPDLPVVSTVTVSAGATVRAPLAPPVAGGVLNGVIRDADGPVGAGVPVLVEQDGDLVATTVSGADGGYEVEGLPAGDYRLEVGRSAPRERPVGPADLLPARRSPGPASSPTVPSPAPTTAELAALAPADLASDRVLPTSTDVTIPATLGSVTTDVPVQAAGRISGTVTGGGGAAVQVVVEDPATTQVLRIATADERGRYAVGGLQQGASYEVWAVDRPTPPLTARMGNADALATADTTGVRIDLDRSALSVSGTVPGATSGTVTLGDDDLQRHTATIDGTGAWRITGIVPGAYPAEVATPGHVDSDPVPAVVREGDRAALALQPGPRPATATAWFISVGAGVPLVRGTARSTTGSVATFSGAAAGHVRVSGLRPGTYSYDADGFGGTAPALDGPWWFAAPVGSFSLREGATTDLGPVVLHARSR